MGSRRLAVLFIGLVLAAGRGMAQKVHLYNPYGRTVEASGTIPVGALGTAPLADPCVAVDAETGATYAVQLANGAVTIAATLGPYEGKVLEIRRQEAPASTGPSISAVRRDDGSILLENAYYRVVLDAAKGYTLSGVTDKERQLVIPAVFGDLTLKRKDNRIASDAIDSAATPDPGAVAQSQSTVSGSVLHAQGPVASVVLAWSCPEGAVRQVITGYAGSRVIEYEVELTAAAPLDYATMALTATGYGPGALIMPDGVRLSGRMPDVQHYRRAPFQVVGFDPDGGETLGLLTAASMRGKGGVYLSAAPEGSDDNALGLHVYSDYLANLAPGSVVRFSVGLLVGGGKEVLGRLVRGVGEAFVLEPAGESSVRSLGIALPAIAGESVLVAPVVDVVGAGNDDVVVRLGLDGERVAECNVRASAGTRLLPRFQVPPQAPGPHALEVVVGGHAFAYVLQVQRAAEIVSWSPHRLILPKGGRGTGTALVRNALGQAQRISLRLTQVTGIAEQEVVWEADIELPAAAQRSVDVQWRGGDREYGRELRLSLLRGGQEVDTRSEFAALGDDYARMLQITVANPGWCSREGQENWLIPLLREGYTGILEYYTWAPDCQYDYTPDNEEWEPHTDSQVAYRAHLRRSFVRKLVEVAHQNGVKVVSHLNGFASLRQAMEHPEEMVYTQDGNPWMYNRKVYPEDGAEYATVFRDYFTDLRVRAWADEFLASIGMFGWDGTRFDCGFYPLPASPDPLYSLPTLGRDDPAGKTFAFDGTDRARRFDRPDATGAHLVELWKARLKEGAPACRFLINHPIGGEFQDAIPQYEAELARDGGCLLQEQMIYTSARKDNLRAWVAELRQNAEKRRALGAQLSVGWFSCSPPGFSSLLHWTAFASGYTMYAWAGARDHPVDTTWSDYRFALRYAEYLYAPDLKWLPADQAEVAITPDEGVLWKDFVYRRDLADGTIQYIVSLINLPEDSEQLNANHRPATPRHGLELHLRALPATLGSAASLATVDKQRFRAYVLLPEPQPHAVALDILPRDGRLAVEIGGLQQFAMVVLELKPAAAPGLPQ